MNEFGTFAKEVALNLDISTSNLRKWSLLLEEAGYEFARNDKNQRIYYERDINALSQMKIFMDKNRNIDDAVKLVIARVKDKKNAQESLSVINKNGTKNGDNITLKPNDLKDLMTQVVKVALNEQQKEFKEVMKDYQQIAATIERLPDPNDNWVAKRKLEHRFREEARKLWNEKPESERMIKSGWFSKIENQSARNDFIQDYIDKNMIEKFEVNE